MSKFIIGKKGVLENVKKQKIKRIYLKHSFPELDGLLNENKHIQVIYQKNDSFFHKFNANHQFVIGELFNDINIWTNYEEFIKNIKFSNIKNIILLVDEIQDSGNFGSIIRSADSFGVLGIIYKKDNQVQINEIVIKTSAGAITNINFLKVPNLSECIKKLKKDGFWIVASSLDDSAISIQNFKNNFDKLGLILGNEKKGISKNLINQSDVKLKIPMIGMSQSLNVSVSCGIMLFYLKYF